MVDEQYKEALKNAKESLERMQKFDLNKIERVVKDLGPKFGFKDVVPAARRLVGLYKRLSLDAVEELTLRQLEVIQNCAVRDFSHLERILEFEIGVNNPVEQRDVLIRQVKDAYDSSFEQLILFICHGVSRTADFKALERDARSANQQMRDEFDKLHKNMEDKGKEADGILAEIRKVAAEHGVSQQAIFFKEEAEEHAKNATDWRKKVWWATAILAFYAVLSILLPAIPWLDKVGPWQLTLSKTLVFVVLGYALFFCAKNYMAHCHNAVVNRHRQNALMTYEALVKANNNPESADIVLTHAARFIYAPQDSGYGRGGTDSGDVSIFGPIGRTTNAAREATQDK